MECSVITCTDRTFYCCQFPCDPFNWTCACGGVGGSD